MPATASARGRACGAELFDGSVPMCKWSGGEICIQTTCICHDQQSHCQRLCLQMLRRPKIVFCMCVFAATLIVFWLYDADTAVPAGCYHGDFRPAPPGSNRYPKPPANLECMSSPACNFKFSQMRLCHTTCSVLWLVCVYVNMESLIKILGVRQSDCTGLSRCADSWHIG